MSDDNYGRSTLHQIEDWLDLGRRDYEENYRIDAGAIGGKKARERSFCDTNRRKAVAFQLQIRPITDYAAVNLLKKKAGLCGLGAAGVPTVMVYALRHTAATFAVGGWSTDEVVQEKLSHQL